jgi:uncharacterized protein YndB with AHSA1/START domain
MATTRITVHLSASPATVYRALLDARAVEHWRVPLGMTSHVHRFEPWPDGAFRISLTYDTPSAAGKTTAQTDTYRGHFTVLVPDRQVTEVLTFETTDPALQGEMRITYRLSAAGQGTELEAVHEGVPPGVAPADNELGWRMSLAKLARWVEVYEATGRSDELKR